MATPRKRARPLTEEAQADCEYIVEHPNPSDKDRKADKKAKKRRRTGSADSPAPSPKMSFQPSPFAPTGKFHKDPNNNMDRHYKVTPSESWGQMTRYNSFVLNGAKYFSEGFVFVANSSTIDRPRNTSEALHPRKKSEEDWVARILEIRASDEHHVYARVYWMYWPDELPARTLYKGRFISGRQPYHGSYELIASNHMDIINVVSVTAPATVNQWDEQNEEEVQQALYWRQAIDVRSMEISSVEERCICREPENPDKTLIRCSNEKCGMWLHDDCLTHAALVKTWERLGLDKPHQSMDVKQEATDGLRQPLSPSDTGAAQTAQQSIDVKPEEKSITLADVESVPNSMADDTKVDLKSIPVAPDAKKRGRRRKSEGPEERNDKPYLGHFTAAVTNESGNPPIMEITDLRHNGVGGESAWKEPVECLRCHQAIQ